ncbi:hypothetical protein Hanom_Chr08g00753991 [Helianthus anomalus]
MCIHGGKREIDSDLKRKQGLCLMTPKEKPSSFMYLLLASTFIFQEIKGYSTTYATRQRSITYREAN